MDLWRHRLIAGLIGELPWIGRFDVGLEFPFFGRPSLLRDILPVGYHPELEVDLLVVDDHGEDFVIRIVYDIAKGFLILADVEFIGFSVDGELEILDPGPDVAGMQFQNRSAGAASAFDYGCAVRPCKQRGCR